MIGRHLDEIPVEGSEKLPVLRLVCGTRLTATGCALKSRLKLRRVETIEEFDKCRARRLRSRNFVGLGLSKPLTQPPNRIQAPTLVLSEEVDDEVLDCRPSEQGTWI